LAKSCEGLEDLLRGLCPDERFRVVVPVSDPGSDVGLQRLDGLVGTAADHLVGQEAEPAFDLVEPAGPGRGEMHMEPGMTLQPRLDRRGLVGAVIVTDQMDVEMRRDVLVNLGQELLELHRTVTAVHRADDVTGGGVKRREQGRDAVAYIVVGTSLGHARHHRQHRLRAVQGLDLALLVGTQHHRALGWIEVQTDDVDDLLHEQRVRGQLERVRAVRLELERAPDPADGGLRQAAAFGHRLARPVRGVGRGLLQGGHYHLLDLVHRDRRRPARPRLVDQPVQTSVDEPGPPLAHGRPGDPKLLGHLRVGQTIRTCQHDPTPQRQRLGTLGPSRPAHQRLTLYIGQRQFRLGATTSSHTPKPPPVESPPDSQADTIRKRIYGAGH
jgi:hypothetical protein